jgi:NAD(P)H-nitrite reductase large subunit
MPMSLNKRGSVLIAVLVILSFISLVSSTILVVEGQKIVDPNTKVTEADIEEAVLEGAVTVEDVQKKTKVGIGYPECLPQVEELIRFYKEKYFG